MSTLSLLFLPGGLATIVVLAVLLSATVLYALYSKGDVEVQFSRGKTCFKLNTKERNLPRR